MAAVRNLLFPTNQASWGPHLFFRGFHASVETIASIRFFLSPSSRLDGVPFFLLVFFLALIIFVGAAPCGFPNQNEISPSLHLGRLPMKAPYCVGVRHPSDLPARAPEASPDADASFSPRSWLRVAPCQRPRPASLALLAIHLQGAVTWGPRAASRVGRVGAGLRRPFCRKLQKVGRITALRRRLWDSNSFHSRIFSEISPENACQKQPGMLYLNQECKVQGGSSHQNGFVRS